MKSYLCPPCLGCYCSSCWPSWLLVSWMLDLGPEQWRGLVASNEHNGVCCCWWFQLIPRSPISVPDRTGQPDESRLLVIWWNSAKSAALNLCSRSFERYLAFGNMRGQLMLLNHFLMIMSSFNVQQCKLQTRVDKYVGFCDYACTLYSKTDFRQFLNFKMHVLWLY